MIIQLDSSRDETLDDDCVTVDEVCRRLELSLSSWLTR